MLLLLMNLLLVFSAGAELCHTDDITTELLISCAGLRFSWLNDVFGDLANLLLFSAQLRCSSAPCPAHLSNYGCHCTYHNTPGESTDPLDRCCLLHRRCHEELKLQNCSRRFPTHTNFTCSYIHTTSCVADASDWCEGAFCDCDQSAISCFANTSFQPDLHNHCPAHLVDRGASNTTGQDKIKNQLFTHKPHTLIHQSTDTNTAQTHTPITLLITDNPLPHTHTPITLPSTDTHTPHTHTHITLPSTDTYTPRTHITLPSTDTHTHITLPSTDAVPLHTHTVRTHITMPVTHTSHTHTQTSHTHKAQLTAHEQFHHVTHTQHTPQIAHTTHTQHTPQTENTTHTQHTPQIAHTTHTQHTPQIAPTTHTQPVDRLTHTYAVTQTRPVLSEDVKPADRLTHTQTLTHTRPDTLTHTHTPAVSSEEDVKSTDTLTHIHPLIHTRPDTLTQTHTISHTHTLTHTRPISSEEEETPDDSHTHTLTHTRPKSSEEDESSEILRPRPSDSFTMTTTHTPSHVVTVHHKHTVQTSSSHTHTPHKHTVQTSLNTHTHTPHKHTVQTSLNTHRHTPHKHTVQTSLNTHTHTPHKHTVQTSPSQTYTPHKLSHTTILHTRPTPFTPSLSHTDTHTISTTSHTHTHSTTHPSHTSAVLNPAPHTGRAITDSAPKITQTGRAITDSAPKITQTGRAITSHAPQLLLPEDEDEEEEDGSEEAAVHQPDSSAEKDTDEPELKQRKSSPFFSWSLLGSAGFPELPLAPPQDECVLSGYHALGQMLLCLTSRCPDEFHTHGCYCSHQDRGTPVDDWDRCCFIHQCCLDQLGRLGCKKNRKLNAHISCENGQAYCVGVSVCDRLQCVCERVTAECMAATHFSNISQSECSGPRPGCMLKPRMPSSHTHTHTLQ